MGRLGSERMSTTAAVWMRSRMLRAVEIFKPIWNLSGRKASVSVISTRS